MQDLYKSGESVTSTANTTSSQTEISGLSLNDINENGQTLNGAGKNNLAPQQNQDPDRDSQGRLNKFRGLMTVNADVKGWLTVPGSNINYPVLQSKNDDSEYYLARNIYRKADKYGSLFIDEKSSVEDNTRNVVIYGHNMTVSGNMFHQLVGYQQLVYYIDRPVINFDTIYQTGKWKIFAVIITNGSSKDENLFDFTRSEFTNSSDFLNFVYQLRVRSLYNVNVDVNENDLLLTLSTCSYELDNYRTVVIARKIRDGENPEVDTESAAKNKNPLYPQSWYDTYGGSPPKVSTFEEASKSGEIKWYSPAK